jgi:hypothetical protein
VAIAAAVAGRSCRVTEPGPDTAVRAFIQAAKTNDREIVYAMLSPATHARLEIEAKRATDYVGAAVRYSPKDLISIGNFETATPTDITVVEEHADRAVVYIASVAGGARIDLVRVDGMWRIDLPGYGPVN